MANPVNQKEGLGKAIFEFTRICVHHTRSMGDGVEPKAARHLFFSQIHPHHVHHSLPMGLHKNIG
jgi:hypothetical protein